jgi:hypothetical protein
MPACPHKLHYIYTHLIDLDHFQIHPFSHSKETDFFGAKTHKERFEFILVQKLKIM